MSDRELLEMAAKAIGLDVYFRDEQSNMPITVEKNWPWNPLENDGDALRLAGLLSINFRWDMEDSELMASCIEQGAMGHVFGGEDKRIYEAYFFDECHSSLPYRRATVRLAALIGQAMP